MYACSRVVLHLMERNREPASWRQANCQIILAANLLADLAGQLGDWGEEGDAGRVVACCLSRVRLATPDGRMEAAPSPHISHLTSHHLAISPLTFTSPKWKWKWILNSS